MPNKLYKYRNFDDIYALQNIQNNIIWASNPNTFNDPYDSQIGSDYDYIRNSYKDIIKENDPNILERILCFIEDRTPKQEEILERYRINKEKIDKYEKNNILNNAYEDRWQNYFAICCFTTKKNNILMWSHYAKHHTGFCIEYDFKNFNLYRPKKVNYSRNLYNIDEHRINSFRTGKEIALSTYIKCALHKAKHWRYENEWRHIMPNINKLNGRKLTAPPISAIYVGTKISEDNKKILIELSKEKNFKVYQMHLDSKQHKLKHKPI